MDVPSVLRRRRDNPRFSEVKRKRPPPPQVKGKEKVETEDKYRAAYEAAQGPDAPWPPLLWKDTPYDADRVYVGGMEPFSRQRLMTEATARGLLLQVDRPDMTDLQIFGDVQRVAGPSRNWFDSQAASMMDGSTVGAMSGVDPDELWEAVEFWTDGPTDDLKNVYRFGAPDAAAMLRIAPVARGRAAWIRENDIDSMDDYAKELDVHRTVMTQLWRRLPVIDRPCVVFSGRVDPGDRLDAGMYEALFNHLRPDRLKMEHTRQWWVTAFPLATSWTYQVAAKFAGSISTAVEVADKAGIEAKARYLVDAAPLPAVIRNYGLVLRLNLRPGQRAIWVPGIHAHRDPLRGGGGAIVYGSDATHDESEILLPPFLKLKIQQVVPTNLKTDDGTIYSLLMIDVSVEQARRSDVDYVRFWPGGRAIFRRPSWILFARVLPDPAAAGGGGGRRRQIGANKKIYAAVSGGKIQAMYEGTEDAIRTMGKTAAEKRWPIRLGRAADSAHLGEAFMLSERNYALSVWTPDADPGWTLLTDLSFPRDGHLTIHNEPARGRFEPVSYRMWVVATPLNTPYAYDAYHHPLWP